ncbi:hypothetical protein IT401_00470 [Candidatus Nomurabacteria bacterium]|nr:hypothetical protein [Candidatus Nomurabacteria bacterium]
MKTSSNGWFSTLEWIAIAVITSVFATIYFSPLSILPSKEWWKNFLWSKQFWVLAVIVLAILINFLSKGTGWKSSGSGMSGKKLWEGLTGTAIILAMLAIGFWAASSGLNALKRWNAPSDELIVQRLDMAQRRREAAARADAPIFRNFSNGEYQAYTTGTIYRYRRGRGKAGSIHMLPEDPGVIVRFEKVANPAIYSICTFDKVRGAQFAAGTDDGLPFEEWQFVVSHDVRMRVWSE